MNATLSNWTPAYIDVGGIKTRYVNIPGKGGTPLVMIHGLSASLDHWQQVGRALAKDRHVIALDLVGGGLTDKPADHDYGPQSLGQFVLDFLDALGIGQVDLTGFSLGGRVALEVAHAAPDRVRALVLVSPASMDVDTIFDFRLASLRGVGEVLTRPTAFGLRMLNKKAVYDAKLITDSLIQDSLVMARQPGAHAAFLRTLRKIVQFSGFVPETVSDIQAKMPQIHHPTLVVWGKNDKFVSVRHATVLESKMPNVKQVIIYDHCGHLPMKEHPDRLAADTALFLGSLSDHTPA